ncbi:hypothetical protein VTL71DRAFT_4001 [Oculimacula yallundae]|uniref:Uncharacterized protein n=1 Tax=Oculimacula yallundae TaxID=86028 RepID=A0ABR4C698_9HELO
MARIKSPALEKLESKETMDPVEYAAREKQLIRRIDILKALANARIRDLEVDLGLKGNQFNTAISVLFAGYIALQIPSNALITRTRTSIYLDIVSTCTAAVEKFTGLVPVRFFLGFVQASYFPGAPFLLSSWYTREELALRTSILHAGSLLAGEFGGLIGAGVKAGLDGNLSLESWSPPETSLKSSS